MNITEQLIKWGLDEFKVSGTVEFPAGVDFEALRQARDVLEGERFTIGQMARESPIAFSKEVPYISKWRDIDPSEYPRLGGVLLSESFRSRPVVVVYFETHPIVLEPERKGNRKVLWEEDIIAIKKEE